MYGILPLLLFCIYSYVNFLLVRFLDIFCSQEYYFIEHRNGKMAHSRAHFPSKVMSCKYLSSWNIHTSCNPLNVRLHYQLQVMTSCYQLSKYSNTSVESVQITVFYDVLINQSTCIKISNPIFNIHIQWHSRMYYLYKCTHYYNALIGFANCMHTNIKILLAHWYSWL